MKMRGHTRKFDHCKWSSVQLSLHGSRLPPGVGSHLYIPEESPQNLLANSMPLGIVELALKIICIRDW